MVKLKRLSASLVLAGAALGLAPSAHAGIPVIDGANLVQAVQQVLNWAKQIQAMKDQFSKLEEQLSEAKAIKGRLEGIKSLGSILDDPLISSILPQEMREAEKLLTSVAHSGQRTDALKEVMERYGIKTSIDGQEVLNGIDSADRLDKMRAVIESNNKRVAQIKQLGARLDTSADAKESMDLIGRNTLEVAQAQMQTATMIATIQANKEQEELRERAAYTRRIDAAVNAARNW